ncbi:MAG: amino acid permease [Steroidobacteraceae bacterium]|nr:amino acid permease [Steroidobacteraceae bacterium]
MNDIHPQHTAPVDVAGAAVDVPAGPRPVLSVFAAVMITVGIVVGAGIFQTPALVASIAGSPLLMLAAWVLGGALSFVGALTYAELASTYPSAGGEYSFLTRAYGRDVSFLFAWARTMVIVTGSIALIAYILGDYLTRLWNLGPHSSAIYAAIAVVVLTAINLAGLRASSRMQNVLTIVEVTGVLLIGVAGFLFGSPPENSLAGPAVSGTGTLGLALVFVLLTYGGWNEAAYVSAELRSGPRAVLRTLLLSITVITLVYLLFVGGLMTTLGFESMKASDAVAVDAVTQIVGTTGGQAIGVLVAVSALTSMNSTMLVGARSSYALARDWPVFGFLGRWHGERSTPHAGFIALALITLALIGFGALTKDGFSTLVEFTAPVFWFFFMLTGIALFVLRRKEPERARPYKVPLYPVLPLVFIATCAYLLYSSVRHAQSEHASYVALFVMLSGAVVWVGLRLYEQYARNTRTSLRDADSPTSGQ